MALLPVGLAALLSWLTLFLAVPRLPEPRDADPQEADPQEADPQEGWAKPPYRALASGRNQVLAALMGAAAGACTVASPAACRPALLVLAGPGAALVLVDALTTYLPRRLNHGCAALLVVAVAVQGMVSGDRASVVRVAIAGAAALLLFWGLWRLGLGFGFGDVRLVGLIGAAAGRVSLGCAADALLLGTLLGAFWGITVTAWRRGHPHPLGRVFAYGPALWGGLWLAVLLH